MEMSADLGEMVGDDGLIMPVISMGNVACGGHASCREHMVETVRLAVAHGVKISAHPGYCDRENFGRVSVELSGDEVLELVRGQVGLLRGICEEEGVELSGIKPHGALYHDMMCVGAVRDGLVRVAREFGLPLVVPAVRGDDGGWFEGCAVDLMREVFADRGYMEDGGLVARGVEGAVHADAERIVAQARMLMGEGVVVCADGSRINLVADTICFHGDHAASVTALRCLYAEG